MARIRYAIVVGRRQATLVGLKGPANHPRVVFECHIERGRKPGQATKRALPATQSAPVIRMNIKRKSFKDAKAVADAAKLTRFRRFEIAAVSWPFICATIT